MTPPSRRVKAATAGIALLAVALTPALQNLPATGADSVSTRTSLADPDSFVTIGDTLAGDVVNGITEITEPQDAAGKTLRFAPLDSQVRAESALPVGTEVTWNESGTPATVFSPSGRLAAHQGQDTAVESATKWLQANRPLLGISQAQVDGLEVVNDTPLVGTDGQAHAVLFRQKFGSLVPATRSMVTVGIARNGDVAFVSSSLTRAEGGPAQVAALSPLEGWQKAASAVGRPGTGTPRVVSGPATAAAAISGEWARFQVKGLAQDQMARLRAFATSDGVVRPAIEANVVDTSGGSAFAYRTIVDAVTGKLLFLQNGVENSNDAFPFQGSYTAAACGPVHSFSVTGETKTFVAVAAAAVASDDITIKFFGPPSNTKLLGTYDLGTSPEAATYAPTGGIPAGTYGVQVCPFGPASMTPTVGGPYSVNVVTSDQAAGTGAGLPNPKWRAFAANPPLQTIASTTGFTPDNSVIECWFRTTTGCTPGETHENANDAGPWDTLNGVPTFTTIGNNANTHEAWGSFLTPGGAAQAPVSPTRDYTTPFTDVWNNSRCALTNFTAGGNDINAVTGNLFTGHNRVHDFAYSLGFTEENYNLQLSNGGRKGAANDPEVGNVQAGAATGGAAGMYMGRDNANQIALQDGVPGITNQYLFQPIAGAFYSPCTDGALDTGIYGHEYTHAISNRMVGGPDDGLTSNQGGAMGESWSDLNAAEYQFENDYSLGTLPNGQTANPWALGSYTTGNFAKGIRDYAINDNPLNYSDYGFDTTGAEVHADGEIWNATQWEVRQALVNKWNAQYPYADKTLQDRCADPVADPTRPQPGSEACPGNRRWLQLIYDAWLMQPGANDMLIARTTMLAADQMRYGGANQDELYAAFARRGMGAGASTPSPDSEDVTPSFRSVTGPNSTVSFVSPAGATDGKVYVGTYEARATPVADFIASTPLGTTAAFTPGIYRITYVSPSRGFRRLVLTVPANGAAVTFSMEDTAANVASAAAGAKLITTTAGSLNAAQLIDGTETTNWSGTAGGANIDDAAVKPSVSVALAGGLQSISSVKVSALLTPAPAAGELPIIGVAKADPDPLSGSRFTALRKFAIETCVSDCAAATASWTRAFTSADDAFPADIPRPVAPDQTMRSYAFAAPIQAAAVRLVALENQCTGQARYAGEQDADASNNTDCKTSSTRGQVVHASELQVFSAAVPADPAEGVAGSGAPGSGTAGQGTSALPLAGQASLVNPATAGVGTGLVKYRTKTRIRLPRVQQVKGRESTKMVYAVVAKGGSSLGKKVGTATVKLDGKKVKRTKMVVRPKQGKKVVGKTYRVPKTLAYGVHKLQVTFRSAQPNAFTSSKSRRITLTVVRTRPSARS